MAVERSYARLGLFLQHCNGVWSTGGEHHLALFLRRKQRARRESSAGAFLRAQPGCPWLRFALVPRGTPSGEGGRHRVRSSHPAVTSRRAEAPADSGAVPSAQQGNRLPGITPEG